MTRGRRRFLTGAVAAVIAMLTLPAGARTDPPHPLIHPRSVDGSALAGSVDISSKWLVRVGDDRRFADPRLDDSDWLEADSARPALSSYGLKNVDLIWYRAHVRALRAAHPLAIYLDQFGGSEVVFVNGLEVGSSGPFPAGGDVISRSTRVYTIPEAALGTGDLTIAIRASIGRQSHYGTRPGGIGPATTILLGTAQVISDVDSLHAFRFVTPIAVNATLGCITVLIALAMAFRLRTEWEYFALALWIGPALSEDVLSTWQAMANIPDTVPMALLLEMLNSATVIGVLEFVRLVLGLRRSRLFILYEVLVAGVGFLGSLYADVINLSGRWNGAAGILGGDFWLLMVPTLAGIPCVVLYYAWKRRSAEALLLSFPFLIALFSFSGSLVAAGLYQLHLRASPSLGAPPVSAIYLSWDQVTNFLISVTFLIFLIWRTLGVISARARAQSEMAAARTMQRILLSGASTPTPGFDVESVYHPAGEVGGDFFLVSPGPDGSLIAIVGDVSGKGLPAAMRVSMILGVLRREDSREPGAILSALNEALLAQGEMGFTTACCVGLDREGVYRIANAGHISPYADGDEIASAPSLPLGLAGRQSYELVTGTLGPGQRLVLMSDGVVEARSARGELYGFERLPGLTLRPAQEIADTALKFGQEDDITVVTIACSR